MSLGAATDDGVGTTAAAAEDITFGVVLRRDRRGDECGLCFSALDIIILLLRACNDDVAILNSPLSCKFKRFYFAKFQLHNCDGICRLDVKSIPK